MKNIFTSEVTKEMIDRINKLNDSTKPLWGTMSADQMFAHVNVAYEMVYEEKHVRPGFLKRKLISMVAKNQVVSDKPYPKSGRTAPQFLIKSKRDFILERKRLVDFLNKTQALGAAHFEGKESFSFGALTAAQWNNLFYKHLDHHLSQFGV